MLFVFFTVRRRFRTALIVRTSVGMQVRPVLFVGFRFLTAKDIFTVCYLNVLHVLNISRYTRHAQSSYPPPKLFVKS